MSAAQFGPHGIYKDFGPAVTHFFNQAQCFLGILTEYQFENSGFEIPDIAVNDGLRFGIVQVDNRHKCHFLKYISMLSCHLFIRKIRLDNALMSSTRFFQNLIGLLKIVISFVYIDQNLSFAQVHHLFQSWNEVGGLMPGPVFQTEFLQFC